MKIAITGASGLVGSTLITLLHEAGHTILTLVRKKELSNPQALYWNPESGDIDSEGLEGIDALIHLAGDNIADGRWSAAKKKRILESREKGTLLISKTIAGLNHPPKVFVSASAIGYYGSRGNELVSEEMAPGTGFLAEVCQVWEKATEAAKQKGIRVVNLRTGMVLSTKGGALAKMLTPFKMGLGGIIASGTQYMSWISLDDLVGIIQYALDSEKVVGPINAVAPFPVTNREFTKTLGEALGRPTVFAMPAVMARLAFGDMADELLIAGQRVDDRKIREAGYIFRHQTLGPTLELLLGEGK